MLWIAIAVLLVVIWWYWRKPETYGTVRWQKYAVIAVALAAAAAVIWVLSHHPTGVSPDGTNPQMPPVVNGPR
ncbi:hypothetical protein GPX89_20725 [Nocardia sp. ET3-3]|uniref:Uncharacterized protein n=1 Tax=Nocardia terrae TaxID=2675851 RepID=A0A7K1V0I4_9NOCA|nr:hypothetical protein [Nocardia terrae]MVU79658.1 hypothetical protein [Nocardia terrae]